jgi:hypothetical protein
MNIPVEQRYSSRRYLWLLALIALPALGWLGVLDRFSAQDIDASIASAGLIYGTARGINALVSLLQGTELNVVFLTISIGEVLDPVNDLIERFSDIILVALGSLALQKILLVVVSHTIFNILLSAVAVCTALSVFLRPGRITSVLLRIFLAIAFLRFSLGLVVLANSWVDAHFLDAADQERHIAMEHFQGELRQLDTLTRKDAEAGANITELQQGLVELDGARQDNQQLLDRLDKQLPQAEKHLRDLRKRAGGLCRLGGLLRFCPDAVKQAQNDLAQLESEQEFAQTHRAAIEESIADLREKLSCLEKHQRGEACNFWDTLPNMPNAAVLRAKMNGINASLSSFAENCINLLVSLLLKTVAIPLLFIYLLLKLVRMNWARI